MEAHFPAFVKKVDKLVKEADDFNRKTLPVRKPKKKKVGGQVTPANKTLETEILEILHKSGPMNIMAIFMRIPDSTYQAVARRIYRMHNKDRIVRLRPGMYDLPPKEKEGQ